MSKFIAMLPDDQTAEEVTKRLSTLGIDDLDWSIVDDTNHDRILPAFAWPGTTVGTATSAPAAVPVVTEDNEPAAIDDSTVGKADSAYFTQAISHGGTAIVIEAPDDRDSDVHAMLRSTEASSIVKE